MDALRSILESSQNIVFFGGAGVSTESGIPDFRSEKGIYQAMHTYGQPPEVILSHRFFIRYPDVFYDFYKKNMLYPDAKPNAAHHALATLERQGRLKAVITQNIDNLHQAAGSQNVLELHGSVYRNHCMDCHEKYSIEAVLQAEGMPRCSCGGLIRPDVVLYEEGLDDAIVQQSIHSLRAADVLIVGGTSLNVYPAAGLIHEFRGRELILINKTPTPFDRLATRVIHGYIGKVLGAAVDAQ